MADVTDEVGHWQPPGRGVPIVASYAHILTTIDGLILGILAQRPPLVASSHATRSGLSEPPPLTGAWDEWARRVRVDLPALRAYGRDVYTTVDGYLATLRPEDLARPFDASTLGQGEQIPAWLIGLVVQNTCWHTGEISLTKGLQGLRGYPF